MKQMFVRQIRQALEERFSEHIELDDTHSFPPTAQEQHFRTRALTALVAQSLTDCTEEQAARFVIDGGDDNGIDAVALDVDNAHIWLIQTKWSDSGAGSLTQDAALKLAEGFRLVLDAKHELFNSRYQALVTGIDQILDDPRIQVTLVLALMGNATIADTAIRPLEAVRDSFNELHNGAEINILQLGQIHSIVRAGIDGPPIDLKVLLDNSGQLTEPYTAYYGSVSADQVASWFDDHRARLFKKNIRTGLGTTSVNQALIATLRNEPENFWYFNNGITMLCDRIERTGRGRLAVGGSGEVMLHNVSIVNGAQTVTAIHRAVEESEAAKSALVWIRIIETANDGEAFATRVTEATNTQNRILEQDFAALDPVQHNLKMAMEGLNKTYLVKRNEDLPSLDEGCTIEEALLALACAHPQTELVVLAKSNPAQLWNRSGSGYYRRLFTRQLNEFRLWRTVLLYRAVRARIDERIHDLENRGEALAQQGDLLTVHLVAQFINQKDMDREDFDWEGQVLPQITPWTDRILAHTIVAVDELFGPNSYAAVAFKRRDRCEQIVEAVATAIQAGSEQPSLPSVYTKAKKSRGIRRARTTSIIIENDLILNDTRLDFRAQTKRERQILTRWLGQNPTRSRATWVNNTKKQLIWEFDGQSYVPTELVKHMFVLAGEPKPPVVQGTKYWYVANHGSLVDIAERFLRS